MKTDWNSLLSKHRGRHRGDYGELVRQCIARESSGQSVSSILASVDATAKPVVGLRPLPFPYPVWSSGLIDSEAYNQMNIVSRLPVFLAGALMPDAHSGYGMPIGGVAALLNAIAPYLVGVDIGCRVTASLFSINGEYGSVRHILEDAVQRVARFGFTELNEDHPVMQDRLWHDIPILRRHIDRARVQLGTSGGGNHFVDLLHAGYSIPGQYAIMCHSGSRGVGAIVAKHYSNLAKEQCDSRGINVPKNYEYLDFGSTLGAEYYEVMRLMTRYSLACHELILARFYREVGTLASQINMGNTSANIDLAGPPRYRQTVHYWSNPHNFASLEQIDSGATMAVVHRKGATPAAYDQVGVIPGSSGTESYVVKGLGNQASLNSASHGAGRPHSRTESKKRHDPQLFEAHMAVKDIHYVGIDPDESAFAYKDIAGVMQAQADLVRPLIVMNPFFVMMGGGRKHDDGD